jgi:hypothetical protein
MYSIANTRLVAALLHNIEGDIEVSDGTQQHQIELLQILRTLAEKYAASEIRQEQAVAAEVVGGIVHSIAKDCNYDMQQQQYEVIGLRADWIIDWPPLPDPLRACVGGCSGFEQC